jgi:hypothetical protein
MSQEQKDDLMLLKEAIEKEINGYKYVVSSLISHEFFYSKKELKYSKDPLIKSSVPWPICEFIDFKLNSVSNYSDELFDLLHFREKNKKYHFFDEPNRYLMTITANFDIRDIYSVIFSSYDPRIVQVQFVNEYQIKCTILIKDSYYGLRNDLRDFVEDFFKPRGQLKLEENILIQAREILTEEKS